MTVYDILSKIQGLSDDIDKAANSGDISEVIEVSADVYRLADEAQDIIRKSVGNLY